MFLVSEKPRTGTQVNELGLKGAWARRATKDIGEGFWEYGEDIFSSILFAHRSSFWFHMAMRP
jgi:hypothetical protein